MFNSINGFAWYQYFATLNIICAYDFLVDKNNIHSQHITIYI